MKERKTSELPYLKPVFKSGYCNQCAEYMLGVRPPVPKYVFTIGFFGPIILVICIVLYFPDFYYVLEHYGSFIYIFYLSFLLILMFSPQLGLLRKIRCTKCGSKPPIWKRDVSIISKPNTRTDNENSEFWTHNIREVVLLDSVGKQNNALKKKIRYHAILSLFCFGLVYILILLIKFIPWWIIPFTSFSFGLLEYYYICRYDGWKNDVLYLRRFHTANDVDWFTSAIEGGLHKKYRLVTLDGNDLKTVAKRRATGRYIAEPIIFILIAIPFVIPLLLTDMFIKDINSADQFSFFFNYNRFIWAIIPSHLFAFGAFFIALNYFRKQNFISIIDSPKRLTFFSNHQKNKRKWQYSAKLSTSPVLTIKTADSMWQDAVLELATISDFVILDVSIPSSALLWEIEQSHKLFDKKTIFVAHKNKFQEWIELTSDPTKDKPNSAQAILGYIKEKSILLYDDPAIFTKSISNVLDNQPRDESSLPLKYNAIQFLMDFYKIKSKSKKSTNK